MATHNGSEGKVKLVGVLNQMAEVRSFSLEISGDTLEVTVMGDSARKYLPSINNWTASIDALWDELDDVQGDLVVGASVQVLLMPEGNAVGDYYYIGTGHVTGVSVSSSFDGMVETSFSVQGTGSIAFQPVV